MSPFSAFELIPVHFLQKQLQMVRESQKEELSSLLINLKIVFKLLTLNTNEREMT